MQRNINHTGRRRLTSSEVQIRLQNDGKDVPVFDVEFSLDKSGLNDKASIYVEAYQRNTLQRFHFGTIAHICKPENRKLEKIDLSGPVLFRVHIVDESQYLGRLIASIDRLPPKTGDDEEQKSSLLVVRARPMNNETWKVVFDTGGKPELCINSRIPDAIGQIKNNPLFQTLIFPAALRQVLMYYIWDNNIEEGSIAEEWINFAEKLAREKPEENDTNELMIWIDDVVQRFSERFELCEMLLLKIEES